MALEAYLTASSAATALIPLAIGTVIWGLLNSLTSPIPSSIPGPFLARFTTKWITLVDLSGRRASTVHALHQEHGPIVRLAPNELSFASKESIKQIYGAETTCIKSPAYNNFGRPGLFHMQNPEQHRQRQRRVAHIFSAGTLQQMEPLVQNTINLAVSAISSTSAKTTDALYWCRLMALDVAGEVLMGKPFGAFSSSASNGGREAAEEYMAKLDHTFITFTIEGLTPTLHWLLSLLPIPSLRSFLTVADYMYQHGTDALEQYLAVNGRTSSRRTLLTKLLAGDPEKGVEPLPDKDVATELTNITFAAVDTTSLAATYALYQLSSNPDWQRRLREEVLASKAEETDFAYKTIQSLPILDAVFHEVLRLHPAAPGGLPRMTTAKNTVVAGLNLPPGTLLSVQSLTTQRDPTVFDEPDKFNPGRWMESDEKVAKMREMMLVWGGKGGAASRMCPGQYMATMEVKILLARLMAGFEVRLASEKTHEEMEMTDHFSLVAKGGRCGLVFEKL